MYIFDEIIKKKNNGNYFMNSSKIFTFLQSSETQVKICNFP